MSEIRFEYTATITTGTTIPVWPTWANEVSYWANGPRVPPTDAEIVAAFELAIQQCEMNPKTRADWTNATHLRVQSIHVPMATVRAAWSRELRRRQVEARERERMRIQCEGDHPEDY